jgi:hypothetical protein
MCWEGRPLLHEALVVGVGEAIAKAILKAWLGDSGIAGDLVGSSVDIIGKLGIEFANKRKLEREFHQIADRIADSLIPFFEFEGARIDDGDKYSIVLALTSAINETDISPISLIKNYDLRTQKLAGQIIDKCIKTRISLSADAASLLDRIASESSTYIIEISARLPEFSLAIFGELLRWHKNMDDFVVEVLKELRRLRETTRVLNAAEEGERFERRYRVAISHRNDEVELFGLDAPSKIRRQNLGVAYVSLSMRRRDLDKKKIRKNEDLTPSWDLPEADPRRGDAAVLKVPSPLPTAPPSMEFSSCNAILASTPRMLIRGEAGSGKTTLLQWIVVNAASQRFDGELSSWNDAVPFLVKLREYADKSLPSPTQMLHSTLPELADAMPAAWLDQLLSDGRAILLIDGVDELDSLKRDEVRKWVRGLVTAFPECRYILTSRPVAVEENWLSVESFDETELLPMGWVEIDTLIDHWHTALSTQPSVFERPQDLTQIADQLKNQLRNSRALADLATSPLLCAMLCALHYEKRQQLPPNRIALYDSAVRMLLDQRDRARGIVGLKLPDLREEQKRAFLERLAYRMLRNGFATAAMSDALAEVSRTRPLIQGLPADATSEKILELLVQRSGIVRSPAAGHIDFVHKTFQEFLGAKAVVDAGDLSFLVSQAEDDRWHETAVLAAGVASLSQRDEFLKALIARGDKESAHRQSLFLLAVACLETAVKLSPETESLIESRIRDVIPPTNMREARSLKAAGSLAVPRLVRKAGFNAREAAACVRALAMIGGEESLQVLKTYATDQRMTVVRELMAGWDSFDKHEYAKWILTDSVLEHYGLNLQSPDRLEALVFLKRLSRLHISNCSRLINLEEFPELPRLSILRLAFLRNLVSLRGIERMSGLQSLYLHGLSTMTAMDEIGSLDNLEDLGLDGEIAVIDFGFITKMKKLKELSLNSRQRRDLNEMMPQSLQRLEMSGCSLVDFSVLSECAELERLVCAVPKNPENASMLSELSRLSVVFVNVEGSNDISWLSNANRLKRLSVADLTEVHDLSPIYDRGSIETISVGGASGLSIGALASKSAELRTMSIHGGSTEDEFPDLNHLKKLQGITLGGVRGLRKINNLRKIPSLKRIVLVECPDIEDYSTLEGFQGSVHVIRPRGKLSGAA